MLVYLLIKNRRQTRWNISQGSEILALLPLFVATAATLGLAVSGSRCVFAAAEFGLLRSCCGCAVDEDLVVEGLVEDLVAA